VQKLSEQHSHKPVLPEESLLNDAPLRARILHVAKQHGVRLVHPSVVKTLNLATELLLTRIVKNMMHAAHLSSKQAKDVPGMVKDGKRNWARDVRLSPHAPCISQSQPLLQWLCFRNAHHTE
jgi:hypothetical protein